MALDQEYELKWQITRELLIHCSSHGYLDVVQEVDEGESSEIDIFLKNVQKVFEFVTSTKSQSSSFTTPHLTSV